MNDLIKQIVPDYRKLAVPTKKPGGHVILNNQHVADTLRCCHCGTQWVLIKGSGIKRGFCLKHSNVTCGRLECNYCIDAERRLEAVEKGENLNQVLKSIESKGKIFLLGEK